jgi:Cu-Zn family superoxide dismutase
MSCLTAIAIFKDIGFIKFHQCLNNNGTFVSFNLTNLPPNIKRALHIHEFGDISKGCESLGGHWNPKNKQHGSIYIDINNSHAGDMLNNIKTDDNGNFIFKYYDPRISIRGDISESIIGRSIVIHEGIDDLGLGNNKDSKITGNAGKRLYYSIIAHTKNK